MDNAGATTQATNDNDSEDDNIDDDLPNQLSSVEERKKGLRSRQLLDELWLPNFHEAAIYIEEGLNNDKFENHPRNNSACAQQSINERGEIQAAPQAATVKKLRTESASAILLFSCNDKQQTTTTTTTTLEHDGRVGALINASRAKVRGSHGNLMLAQDRNESEIDVDQLAITQTKNSRRLKAKHIPLLSGIQYTTVQTYVWAHNKHIYLADLIASLVLLLLALVEPPSVDRLSLTTIAHASIEITALAVVGLELMLKFRWMGPERFFRHGRTIAKLFVLLTMIIEAIVIVARQSIHSRYSRCLRPIFLFSNHYCHGIRRTIRQIFLSMAPIFDMFTLMMFFMFIFTIVARYVLSESNQEYFGTMASTWGNLLVMTTTGNMPDIMMASYEASRRRRPNRIKFKQFHGLMRYLNPQCKPMEAFLVFKALDTDSSGYLTLDEFYRIYDFINLSWRQTYPSYYWYDKCTFIPDIVRSCIANLRIIIENRYFDSCCYAMICLSGILQFIDASSASPAAHEFKFTTAFIGFFIAEVTLRVTALGFTDYLRQGWNRFDLVVLALSLIGLIQLPIVQHLAWLYVLRVFKLIKLFEYKRRYWDVWQTLAYIMMKRFVSMACVVMMFNYSFAILGMELFSEYDLRNCCVNTSLEAQFKFIEGPNNPNIDTTTVPGTSRYYLNDFGDIVASYMTLFSMTSSTFWLTLMNAYAIVTGTNWSRLYFAVFYIASLIVMNIFIAILLESFLFRINHRKELDDGCDETNLFTVEVALSEQEDHFVEHYLRPRRAVKNRLLTLPSHPRGYGILEESKMSETRLTIPANHENETITPTKNDRFIVSTKSYSSQATSSSSSSSVSLGNLDECNGTSSKRCYPNVGHLIRHSAMLRNQNDLRGCKKIYKAEQTRNRFE
ncbi:Two pore calcium channel protein 1 [Fragariocoptes setiger]|uniref:Two pore calcium channel protein 1 n=1 Tax=Fragariocoptes setiger TaxID=1670756 RepID=A0ABQ7SCH5_9ACAR|nr:Two pore calcium channel protein 1 [Fragariocoptes setiger]